MVIEFCQGLITDFWVSSVLERCPWYPVASLIDAFDKQREWCISPGTVPIAGGTEVLSGLEVMEVNKATLKAFNADFGEGTAVVIRLSQTYGHTIIEDNAIASVLAQLNSLLSNRMNRTKIYALCWNDQNSKVITSNRGITLPGSDSVRVRRRCVIENGEIR
ncbi:Hypothetical protein PHPALM_36188 [Phytophthora palmivora]|uniref:Uncharacterized protein n=1 Tax=Phytophthora palmivora TaxID=4796 RepID=A0A2P4X0L8_9STRA|nr:Hypothetical protein PHPALM_36188 [Phytophthora palmivora]